VAAGRGIECHTVRALAHRAEFVILSLPLARHVEDVCEGPDGLIAQLKPGATIIDMSTSEPQVSRRLAKEAEQHGIVFLDAPVSGGPAGAAAGTLTVMVGGYDAGVNHARPVLDALAAKVIHVGAPGAGNVAKLVNNLLVAVHLISAAEAVRLAEAAGVPAYNALNVVNMASGRSAVTEINYPRWILSGAFDSGFTMGLMRKDVLLALALANETGMELPVSQLAASMWGGCSQRLADGEDFNRIATLLPSSAQ
jgi:3-hydroxyisobutyrate dehydrogenase